MSMESGTTRWWEYYLPRYLMPSIAGAVIVNWLCSYVGNGLRGLLSLPANGRPLDTSSVILLFLYGNLFCYIASYPVLVFHATRVMDFNDGSWPGRPLMDGYLLTVVLLAGVSFLRFGRPEVRYWLAFAVVGALAVVQLLRLGIVLSRPFEARGHGDRVSPVYFYSYVLAHRRGMPVVEEETKTAPPKTATGSAADLLSEEEEDEEEVTTTRSRTNLWRREFMDTYRHLREHGNSAFIFLLEIVLAVLACCVITKPGQSPQMQLGALGFLFSLWAIPSVFVHLLAQHLERRFSRYEQRLRSDVGAHIAVK